MKRAELLVVFTLLLFTLGCRDDYQPINHPTNFLVFHNTLSTGVDFNISDSPYGRTSLEASMRYESGALFNTFFKNGPAYSNGSVFLRIHFTDGRVKTDRRCDEFLLEPALYNLCMQDTVSVFRLSNYQIEIKGNDTLYHYFISQKDSLEAI